MTLARRVRYERHLLLLTAAFVAWGMIAPAACRPPQRTVVETLPDPALTSLPAPQPIVVRDDGDRSTPDPTSRPD